MTDGPPRRDRHLIDPSRPRPRPTAADRARLERVQRTVLSVLAATTIFHLSAGLVIGAQFIDDEHRVSQVGLCVLGGAFGVIGLAAAFAIHRRAVLTPWLLVGLLPMVVGLVFVYR